MSRQALLNRLIPTLFEDDHLLAITKPAGIDVGRVTGRDPCSLLRCLVTLRGLTESAQPINRLGRYESGVLLVAKDPDMVRYVRTGLKTGRIVQEYIAVVLGRVRQPHLVIAPSASGEWKAGSIAPPRVGRFSAPSRDRSLPSGRTGSQTTLHLIRRGERRTLVRCRTHLGDTHTLRAQLRAVKLRLLGDRLHDRSPRTMKPEQTRLHLERITFHHPAIKSKITVVSPVPDHFSDAIAADRDIAGPLHAALARRLACVSRRDTDSYRLICGDFEGIKGLVAERYGHVVILQVHGRNRDLEDALGPIARWYRKMLGVKAVYVKRFVKNRSTVEDNVAQELHSSKPLVGKAVSQRITITENGLRFAIRPYDGFSVGLFLDHRENRTRLQSLAAGRTVLNLFAYTCGFSVAAASGGADHTVSVDISSKYLEWGRANFELNGLDPAGHEFIPCDGLDFLKRCARQERFFDVVVLDPPTFAHGRKRKRRFSIARDLAPLIAAVVAILKPNGVLMLSTSYRQASVRWLRDQVQQAATPCGGAVNPCRGAVSPAEGLRHRRFKVLARPALPVDFAVDPDHAKTLLVRFE